MSLELAQLLRRFLADWDAGWSMGSFGAIAEFHQDAAETAVVDDPGHLTRATLRGAIHIDKGLLEPIVAVAYETPSPKPHRWSHGLALCLPIHAARRSARSVLTELGPDGHAIRPDDRPAILFDMGLGLAHCDFCVRTSDLELLDVLRTGAGRSLFAIDNPALPAILRNHPHRVAMTNVGRVEVFQKIGGPDTGGASPPGPHTHLLPKLLASGRTHSANIPIPEGLTPCAYVHPGNPVIGPLGEDRDFAPQRHDAFQAILRAYGASGVFETKANVIAGLERGLDAQSFAMPDGRYHRAAVRVALRQQARAQVHSADGCAAAALSNSIARWRARFDPTADRSPNDGPDDRAGDGIGEHD